MGLFTHRTDVEKIARIARNAKGPAAKQLAWEGWLAAESAIAGFELGELGVRDRFEEWWGTR